MDITDISKVASRKMMNTDAEKLKEKVSRETTKIIKLKVAQDTAYWDLKERLQQLGGAHERLQQNMLDVQMQHEATSAQYQRELRLRPDTLNKLHGTRQICDVLEDYGSRLQRSVERCRADRDALGAAYGLCAARLRRRAEEHAAALRRKDEAAAAMRDDVARLVREFDAQSSNMKRNIAQQEKELQEGAAALRSALSAGQAAERLASEQAQQLTRELSAAQAAGRGASERAEQLARELTAAQAAGRGASERAEQLARELSAAQAAGRGASEKAEQLARQLSAAQAEGHGASERAEQLARELSEACSACDAKDDALQRLRNECQDATNTIDQLRKEVMTHVENIKHLQKVVNDKALHENDLEADISSLKQYLCRVEAEKLEVSEQLDKAVQECGFAEALVREGGGRLAELQAAAAAQREADAKKIEELAATVGAKQRELDANSGAITSLMAELKADAEARARAETERRRAEAERDDAARAKQRELDANTGTIASLMAELKVEAEARRQAEAERDDAAARSRQLDDAARAKDVELGAQVAIVLDMRAEKEQLQERIQGMENTIDNIQKELVAPAGSADAGEPPKLDAAPPRHDDSALFNFLSDDSVDDDSLDPREVSRRFAALVRGGGPKAQRRLQATQGSISLSQLKNDSKSKSRTFHKIKRLDGKLKKLKQRDQ